MKKYLSLLHGEARVQPGFDLNAPPAPFSLWRRRIASPLVAVPAQVAGVVVRAMSTLDSGLFERRIGNRAARTLHFRQRC